jgi:hypothetical protein
MRSRKHAQIRPSPVPVALLIIDVLTTFQFPDGDAILRASAADSFRAELAKDKASEDVIKVYLEDAIATEKSFETQLTGFSEQADNVPKIAQLGPGEQEKQTQEPRDGLCCRKRRGRYVRVVDGIVPHRG